MDILSNHDYTVNRCKQNLQVGSAEILRDGCKYYFLIYWMLDLLPMFIVVITTLHNACTIAWNIPTKYLNAVSISQGLSNCALTIDKVNAYVITTVVLTTSTFPMHRTISMVATYVYYQWIQHKSRLCSRVWCLSRRKSFPDAVYFLWDLMSIDNIIQLQVANGSSSLWVIKWLTWFHWETVGRNLYNLKSSETKHGDFMVYNWTLGLMGTPDSLLWFDSPESKLIGLDLKCYHHGKFK
jgi:hypothetical protein